MKAGFMAAAVLIIAAIVLVFLFTPLGFGPLPLNGEYRVKIHVNGHELTATMENNSSSMALKKVLSRKPKTIRMRDYGSMEKVGMLWRRYPVNNRQITAEAGDIILYMGSSLVVYYESNSWNFTRLGRIENASGSELRRIFGEGSVEMTFELID